MIDTAVEFIVCCQRQRDITTQTNKQRNCMSTTQCVYYVCDDDDDDGVSRRDEYELRSPTAVTFGAVGITLPLCRYKPNCLMTEAQCV